MLKIWGLGRLTVIILKKYLSKTSLIDTQRKIVLFLKKWNCSCSLCHIKLVYSLQKIEKMVFCLLETPILVFNQKVSLILRNVAN